MCVCGFFCTDATPTLLELKTMEETDGTPLNIIERVAAGDYMTFGMCLLQDVNGDKVESIKRDRTYEHLIKCLNKSKLGTLIADNRYRTQQ